jgi:alpha-tubulin suppressor-like RCC1 family protein
LVHRPQVVVAGTSHLCIIDDNRVKCFASHVDDDWFKVPSLINPRELVAGYDHTCALHDGGVACWRKAKSAPIEVPAVRNPHGLVAHGNHSCLIDDDGVKCWGDNESGQNNIPTLTHPRVVATGGTHACAIADEGVKCWGSNLAGESSPPPLANPKQLAAGKNFSCAVDNDQLICWGYYAEKVNREYRLRKEAGQGKNVRQLVANDTGLCYAYDYQEKPGEKVATHTTCLQNWLSSSGYSSIALSDTYRCTIEPPYGYLDCEELGNAFPTVHFRFPVQASVEKVAVGGGSVCLALYGTVQCWLLDHFFSIWDNFGHSDQYGTPAEISAGGYGTCVRGSKGNISCVVLNGRREDIPQFTAAPGLAVGQGHACAVDVSKGLRCWGKNEFGQLNAPAMINPESLSSFTNHTCAIGSEGLRCWGENNFGQSEFPAEFAAGVSSLEKPGFHLDQLPSFLALAQKISSSARVRIFADAGELLKNQVFNKDLSNEASQSRYLLTSLLAPAVLSGDSSYAQSTLNPAFTESLGGFTKALGANGIDSVAHTPRNNLIALTEIKSALGITGDFLGVEDRISIQTSLRSIGQAIIDSGNSEKIAAALSDLNTASSTLEKISHNSKSAFLVETIRSSAAWLKGAL